MILLPTRKTKVHQFVFEHENYLQLLQNIVDYFVNKRNESRGVDYTELMEDTTIVFDNASQSYIATVYCLYEAE